MPMRSKPERTSSFVMIADVSPFTRVAQRPAPAANTPHGRAGARAGPHPAAGDAQAVAELAAQFGRERTRADARAVGLRDADDVADRARPDAEAGARAAGDRVRTRDERIGAVADVEHRPLRALDEDPFAALERAV